MIQPSEILVDLHPATDPPSILQLYQHLELFSEGDPVRNSLFILGRPALEEAIQSGRTNDELLVIDPPADVTERFKLGSNVAALYSGAQYIANIPRLQLQSGGIAHLRIGNHYLDIYTQTDHTFVYLPALGILYAGRFGSSDVVPDIGRDSDGNDELDTLRILAGIVKLRGLQLFVSHVGNVVHDKVEAMQRLAADVAYIHGLRRTLPDLAARSLTPQETETLTDTLLPTSRRNRDSAMVHSLNVQNLLGHFAT